ncbi:ferritin-like domain-containing protein [Heliorestis convoluta]|uniref:Putative ferritin-like domain protein n=1 Tax=Heliorestis convoluta TaxID=356322 RepID=A0A5Q2N559_9FIRM|nr:ferritin-like domain-containing protein [Heliorestis convoluta]QGG48442.1 putative ferritin-like domain protein [Heliorestis convoluta]
MSLHDIRGRFAIPEPYPEIKVAGKNIFYAQLLLDPYASNVSEVNAINQYLYHYFRFDHACLKDIAELEEGISIVEMYHMEILAELILKLGGDPRYVDSKNCSYNASFVYYGRHVLDMLAADMEAERSAILQYRRLIDQIDDPYVKAILRRIIKDEQHHLKLFTEAYRRYQQKAGRTVKVE